MKYEPHKIIRKPVVSEKSTLLIEKDNKYVFEVDTRSNKIQIKQAVEELFKVSVTKVRTMRVRGKAKRVRFKVGLTPERKKAIVTLKKGDRIDLF